MCGQITVAGAPVPAADQSLGALHFYLQGGGVASSTYSPSGLGLASYSLTLLKGTYTTHYVSFGTNDCTRTPPCVTGPLPNGSLTLTSNGTANFDVPAIAVQGSITVNGQVPGGSKNGTLMFALTGGGSVSTRATGPRRLDNYALKLLPGSYTVSFQGGPGCPGSPAQTPCNSGVVQSALMLTSTGTVNLDVPSVAVTGQITVNGTANSSTAGQALFKLNGGGDLGTGALGSYSIRLLKGVYDIDYAPLAAGCTVPGTVPCTGGRVQSGVSLTTNGTVNLDTPMVTVSGLVTLNGATLPSSDGDRGHLQFSASGGAGTCTPFGSTGPINYQMRLFPGSYAVQHKAQPTRCANGFSQGGIPCIDQYVAGCP